MSENIAEPMTDEQYWLDAVAGAETEPQEDMG